jgi:uncharacterized repeat protein (TIGR03803 family)
MRFPLKCLGLAVFALAELAPGQSFNDLYNFMRSQDGGNPWSTPIRDAAGNLYGTTYAGGNFDSSGICNYAGCGVVYELDTAGNETPLYAFNGAPDGQAVVGGVVADASGNLYGTTAYGGANSYGTVFMISVAGGERILQSFTGGADGGVPHGGLVIDQGGNLFGTTFAGGSSGLGTVFEVTASGQFSTLYTFPDSAHGSHPNAALTLGADGNLYGTTQYGGASNRGTVFRFETGAGTETVLYSFTGMPDGAYPQSQLVFHGNALYGTTTEGGSTNNGTVFRISTSNAETVIHNFGGTPDGSYPIAGVVMDNAGNIYGTTLHGGSNSTPGAGTVYKIDTAGNETPLYSFQGSFDGQGPASGLVLNATGTAVYGTTEVGGFDCCGDIYSVTLP